MAQMMPASISYTLGAITKKIDQFDQDDKENLEEIQGLELESALNDLELKNINTQIQVVQAKSKLEKTIQSIMNPQPQQTAPANAVAQAPQPGQSVEAAQPQNPVQAPQLELQGALA